MDPLIIIGSVVSTIAIIILFIKKLSSRSPADWIDYGETHHYSIELNKKLAEDIELYKGDIEKYSNEVGLDLNQLIKYIRQDSMLLKVTRLIVLRHNSESYNKYDFDEVKRYKSEKRNTEKALDDAQQKYGQRVRELEQEQKNLKVQVLQEKEDAIQARDSAQKVHNQLKDLQKKEDQYKIRIKNLKHDIPWTSRQDLIEKSKLSHFIENELRKSNPTVIKIVDPYFDLDKPNYKYLINLLPNAINSGEQPEIQVHRSDSSDGVDKQWLKPHEKSAFKERLIKKWESVGYNRKCINIKFHSKMHDRYLLTIREGEILDAWSVGSGFDIPDYDLTTLLTRVELRIARIIDSDYD